MGAVRAVADRKLRTAVIGLGAMGLLHVLAIQKHPELELVGCSGHRPRTELPPGAVFFPDSAAMLEQLAPELVVVATPPASHAEWSDYALTRGAHVLCEKPLAHDLATAEAMTASAAQVGSRAYVNLQLRESPLRTEAKRRLDAGVIGNLICLRAEGGAPGFHDGAPDWYRHVGLGGGALMEFGTHLIDQMLWLGGPIKAAVGVSRTATQSRGPLDGEDLVCAVIEFEGGHVGDLFVSTLPGASRERSFEIVGESGALRLHGEHLLEQIGADGEIERQEFADAYSSLTGDPEDSYTQPLQRLYAHLADVLLRDASPPPLATFAEATRVQAVIESIRESHTRLALVGGQRA